MQWPSLKLMLPSKTILKAILKGSKIVKLLCVGFNNLEIPGGK